MKLTKIALCFLLAAGLLNACRKEYSLEGGSLKIPSGTWEFKDSLTQYLGDMDSAYIVSGGSLNTKELNLVGHSKDGSQTFALHLYADTFKVGVYKASFFQSAFEYTEGTKTIYQASQLIGEFIVNITSYSDDFISGTFTGKVLDSVGNSKLLTQGKFSSTIGGGTSNNGVSTGVLGDSSGNCKPVTLSGVYTKGIVLTSANTVQAQVTVATAGTYSINTNTVNGITFSKSGTFTSTGVQNVVLTGSGTPTNSGDQTFTLNYGNSKCSFTVNFGLPADGTLGGGGGNCTPFTFGGVYQQELILNASNTVQIQVNVTTTGNYNITTNSVNGVSFSSSGNFSATGVQTVTLTGTGTPLNAGLQNFSVTFGASTCNFSITFTPGVIQDYFPVTLNSNWTYGLEGGAVSDSINNSVISYSPILGGKTYSTIESNTVPASTLALDSFYYRKPGGDYYEYINYQKYIPFEQSVQGEFIFLKDNVPAGTTWTTPSVNGTIAGSPVSGYVKMTILEKGVSVTIGANTFPDVIKVQYDFFINFNGVDTGVETDERWFANNVGEIHFSSTNNTQLYDIGSYKVL
jgi:hypothetical protein